MDIGDKSFNPLEKLWLERIDENVYVVRNNEGLGYKFAPASQPVSAIAENQVGDSEINALRLTEIADRNGARVTLSYEQGRLSYIEDSAGRRLNFVYIILDNGAARLAGINRALDVNSSRNSRLVNYSYDANGRLINVTDRGLIPWRYAYVHDYLLIRVSTSMKNWFSRNSDDEEGTLIFDPVKSANFIGFMALNLAHSISFRSESSRLRENHFYMLVYKVIAPKNRSSLRMAFSL